MYDKDGNLITENDDNGKNMGTYNYASSSKDAGNHTKYDVKTYKDWGNTPSDPKLVDGSWNDNVKVLLGVSLKWGVYKYSEPRYKGKTLFDIAIVDEDARKHYIDVCNAIGIDYSYLLYNKFSIV